MDTYKKIGSFPTKSSFVSTNNTNSSSNQQGYTMPWNGKVCQKQPAPHHMQYANNGSNNNNNNNNNGGGGGLSGTPATGYSQQSYPPNSLSGDMLTALNPNAAPPTDNNLRVKFSKDAVKKSANLDELLKVTIKKQGGGSLSLSLVPFPDINPQRRMISSLANADTMDQVEKFSIPQLRESLETLRKSYKNFHNNISAQVDSWDNWRQRNGLSKSQDKRRGDVDPAANRKKFKKENEEEDNNDSDYEDDIDVDEFGTTNKKKGRKRQDKKIRNSSFNDSQFLPETSSSSAGPSSRDRRAGRRGDVFYNEDDIDFALGLGTGKKGKPNFWGDMEIYFSIPTPEDYAWLRPTRLDPEDEVIPPCGRYYREKWKEEDDNPDITTPSADDSKASVQRRASVGGSASSTSAAVAQPQALDEPVDPKTTAPCKVTQRLLGALVAEAPAASPQSSQLEAQLRNMLPNAGADSLPLRAEPLTDTEVCLPLDVPATYDFSRTAILNLEERIKLELRSIGLFGPPEVDPLNPNSNKGEDEVYHEILNLQKQLKDQIAVNNTWRERLLNSVPSMTVNDEKFKKERQANIALEKQYQKMVRKKKKANK